METYGRIEKIGGNRDKIGKKKKQKIRLKKKKIGEKINNRETDLNLVIIRPDI